MRRKNKLEYPNVPSVTMLVPHSDVHSVGLLGNDLYQVIHTPLNKAYISRGVSDPEDSNSLWFMK